MIYFNHYQHLKIIIRDGLKSQFKFNISFNTCTPQYHSKSYESVHTPIYVKKDLNNYMITGDLQVDQFRFYKLLQNIDSLKDIFLKKTLDPF